VSVVHKHSRLLSRSDASLGRALETTLKNDISRDVIQGCYQRGEIMAKKQEMASFHTIKCLHFISAITDDIYTGNFYI